MNGDFTGGMVRKAGNRRTWRSMAISSRNGNFPLERAFPLLFGKGRGYNKIFQPYKLNRGIVFFIVASNDNGAEDGFQEVNAVQLSIVGRRVEVTDAIREYLEKRLMKLKKYFPRMIDVHVILYTQKINQVAEVTVKANGLVIHGEEKSEDLYASIDKVVDKLDAQLRKHKERLVDHQSKKSKDDRGLNLNISVFEKDDIEGMRPSPQVIHTKKFTIKPMSVDEAAMQMDLISQEFLVFKNSANERLNVIYRLKDGNYGLIEPDA